MRKNIAVVFTAVLAISAAARAADIDFDGATGKSIDIQEILSDTDKGPGFPGGQPHPGFPGGHHDGGPGDHHDGDHGGPGWHPGPQPFPGPQPHPGPIPGPIPHPGPGPGPIPQPHPNPPPPPPAHYVFGGYVPSCQTIEFNSQSPLNVSREMTIQEYGQNCQAWSFGGPEHCTPVNDSHRRTVNINIGPRALEQWETERLQVCMNTPTDVQVNTAGMLYEYAVTSRNDSGLFNRATTFTLTPGAKKPSQPVSGELLMTFAGVTTTGELHMVLQDSRADYFRGEKITISVAGSSLPEPAIGVPPSQIDAGAVKIDVTKAFDVAQSYDLKLLDAPRPGKYAVTVKFFRSGALSSGAEASIPEAFEVR